MKTQNFRDFDAFAESIKGVDSKMLLRNPEHRLWSHSVIDLLNLPVQVGRLGSGNIAQGELQAEGCLLYVPLTEGCHYVANGTSLDTDSLAVLTPGSEFCISTRVAHDWCAVTLPRDMFEDEHLGDRPAPGIERASVHVISPELRLARKFHSMMKQVIATATETPSFELSPAASSARAELIAIAYRLLMQQAAQPADQAETRHEGRPRISREAVITRSRKLLEQCEGERVLIGDLATAADVSERTLRTVFNDYFGVSPIRYLQLRQLHRVRRALRDAEPEATTVSAVLVGCGEWEFSRFASRYRRQFGELPSDTLHQSARRGD